LCHKGEIYTQDMAFPCIYQNGIYTVQRCDYYQQPATRRKYTPRDNGIPLHISEWDLHGAAKDYYQQLVPRRKGHGISIYQNGIYTVQRCDYYHSSLCHKGEIYTQGHGIPPCIYQNGIYTVPP
jgi:hypothetical protein